MPVPPGFPQDPRHEQSAFVVPTVGCEGGKGGSDLESQGLASTCTYMKSNKIKCDAQLSAQPHLCLSPRAKRGEFGSGAERDTHTLQTLTARAAVLGSRRDLTAREKRFSPTQQMWLVQGAETGAKMHPPA